MSTKLNYVLDGTKVRVTAYDGEKFTDEAMEIVREVEFDAAAVPEELKAGDSIKSLAGYGLLKLLQDRTSGEQGAMPKLEGMEMYMNEYFLNGLWKKPSERKPAASKRKISAALAQAVAQLQGITAIQAEGALKDLDKDRFAQVAGNPNVVALVSELEAEARSAGADLAGLFGDVEAVEEEAVEA